MACKGLKILVAEDNAVNQKLISILLKNLGCEVDLVTNGEEAVEKAKMNHYDLCLMDIMMPVIGGYEATRRIRNHGDRELPIIALTAAAMKGDREEAVHAGMDDYLVKPLKPGLLKEKILEWISPGGRGAKPGEGRRIGHRKSNK